MNSKTTDHKESLSQTFVLSQEIDNDGKISYLIFNDIARIVQLEVETIIIPPEDNTPTPNISLEKPTESKSETGPTLWASIASSKKASDVEAERIKQTQNRPQAPQPNPPKHTSQSRQSVNRGRGRGRGSRGRT